jgi:hypothetical protein
MINKITLVAMAILAISAFAEYNVTFTPTNVAIGSYGYREGYIIVISTDGKEYNLGYYSDELSKLRYALVLTAITQGKQLNIGSWWASSQNDLLNLPRDNPDQNGGLNLSLR